MKPGPARFARGWLAIWLWAFSLIAAAAPAPDHPRYKPSSRSPEPMDIRTNAYGASRSAPDALEIGDTAPDFTLPRAGGGALNLADLRGSGPVALIFYRGHW
jgi:hypothetical protein